MKEFTIYTANCTDNAKNCIYPTEVAVKDIASLERAMQRDHVCAMYRDHKRSAASFEWSDCIPMDCDNDHSEDPAQWKHPEDVVAAFPNVTFAVCYSRNHMKEKKGKTARPRVHCYFPINRVCDGETYAAMKQRVYKKFPFFDDNALDIARFCFGTEQPEVMFFAGDKTVDQMLPTAITAGSRNAALSQKAGKLIKRYGDTAEAERLFKIEAERCVPPLSDDELASIWSSAKKFGERIADSEDYIPPELFGAPLEKLKQLHPEDNKRYPWTELGAGKLFADYYRDVARYVQQRKNWYCYSDGVWSVDLGGLCAMEYCMALANDLMRYCLTIQDERIRQEYMKFCSRWQTRKMRETVLKDARGVHKTQMEDFDRDPYAFNCANGTLHLGTMEFTEHRAEDMLTKKSNVIYDPKARCERFEQFIAEITCDDQEKAKFLQKVLGYGIIGDTRYECLYIFYGATTRNGKGTLCESVLKVLGSYGCTVRAETIGVKRNSNSQMPSEDVARLAGVRFANIAEPGRGLLLDAALVKSMTGNDTLNARFLHENSFDFKPQFKLYINTNYRPSINDLTLFNSDRVVVVPFERHFEESEQDKNLKALFAKPASQSAILNWLIEGYQLIQKEGLRIPKSVRSAIAEYRKDSDKIMRFVEDCLEKAENAEVRTADVYRVYREWCAEDGCYAENRMKFNQGLRSFAQIERKRPAGGGAQTTMLLGYRLTGASFAHPL